jgi:hypothetical protein
MAEALTSPATAVTVTPANGHWPGSQGGTRTGEDETRPVIEDVADRTRAASRGEGASAVTLTSALLDTNPTCSKVTR